MPRIRDILTNPIADNLGLIPYLTEALGGEWDRFQLRPWDFKSPELASNGNNSGFRLGLVNWHREDDNCIYINQEVRVGYQITSDDPLELQIAAGELSIKFSEAISTWSCCTIWAEEIVLNTTGNYAYSPNPTISSGNSGGWTITVIVEFELIYKTMIGV